MLSRITLASVLAITLLDSTPAVAQCVPEIVSSIPLTVGPWGVSVRDGIVFVSDESAGLRIIDATNPNAPSLVGSGITGDTRAVSLEGDLGYVANSFFGMSVLDLSNLAAPVQIGSVDTPSFTFMVTHRDNYVYLADFFAGVQVVDVTDPIAPVIVATLDTIGQAVGAALCGDTLFIADQGPGVQVINVKDPTNPTLVTTMAVPGGCRRLTAVGSTVYGATDSGMQLIDASDPTNPTLLGAVALGDLVSWIDVQDSVAYVATFSAGLQVVDVSNPLAPTIIATLPTPGDARGVAVEGDYAYVAIFQPPSLEVVKVDTCSAATYQPWVDACFFLNGTYGAPRLEGTGTLIAGDPVSVQLTNALENTTATLVIGLEEVNLPFKGGTLVPDLFNVTMGLPTGPNGEVVVASVWPPSLPSGLTTYHQFWVSDPAGPNKFSASNAVAATTP